MAPDTTKAPTITVGAASRFKSRRVRSFAFE